MVFTVTAEGEFCSWSQNLIRPVVKLVLRDGERTDVGTPRLVDRHTDSIDVVDTVEQLQCTEGIQFHLWIVIGFDQNTASMFVVHDVQSPVSYDDAVAGAESFFYIFGVVKALLDKHQRVCAGFLGFLNEFQYEGSITIRTILHLRVVPCEVFGRVFSLHVERLTELKLTEGVGVGAFSGEVAVLILVAFAEPCRGWAVKPPV